jgi:hypothetical protein
MVLFSTLLSQSSSRFKSFGNHRQVLLTIQSTRKVVTTKNNDWITAIISQVSGGGGGGDVNYYSTVSSLSTSTTIIAPPPTIIAPPTTIGTSTIIQSNRIGSASTMTRRWFSDETTGINESNSSKIRNIGISAHIDR